MKMLKNGPLGAVGTVRSFMNVVKDIDFEETRNRAEQVPSIHVIAENDANIESAITELFGEHSHQGVTRQVWQDGSDEDLSRYDVVIVYDPDAKGLFDKVKKAQGARKSTSHIMFLSKRLEGKRNPVETIRKEIMDLLPDMAPSFGRHHPEWRPAAVSAIVDQTSRANAQFALVSNIPAVVPVLGGLVSASADLLVMTKNQLMMCYKIAAAHDQDLSNHMAIVRELTPVVGAGFLWRTAARQAATFIPFAAGTIPKVGIAFAGTLTMGKAADYYYHYGSAPGRSQLAEYRDLAVKKLATLPFAKDDRADDGDAIDTKLADKKTADGETQPLPPGDTADEG